jgi:hypothetical protein
LEHRPGLRHRDRQHRAGFTGGTWVNIDVTSAVQADGPHDFGLQTTGSQINLASRDDTAGHAPQLIIEASG